MILTHSPRMSELVLEDEHTHTFISNPISVHTNNNTNTGANNKPSML